MWLTRDREGVKLSIDKPEKMPLVEIWYSEDFIEIPERYAIEMPEVSFKDRKPMKVKVIKDE